MFCWKNISAIITLFSFIFGFDSVIPVLNEQAALAQTRREKTAMPTSRSICLTKGTLTFGTGVKQTLFR